MRFPRLSARPWVAAATVAVAAAILVTVGVGNTHATEPTNPQIAENSPAGTSAGTPLTATSSGDVTYTLSGADAEQFTIDAATGELTLADGASLDFETKNSYDVTITATSDLTVNVTNADDFGDMVLDNNTPAPGETINATVTDPDGGIHNITYRWTRSLPGDSQLLSDVTGSSYVVTSDDIGYYIHVSALYSDIFGFASVSRRTTHKVENDPPQFAEGGIKRRAVDENSPAGTLVGTPVVATDPNGETVTYSITSGANF